MGLFDILKSGSHHDPVLGTLKRQGGRWTGSLTLPDVGIVPLLVAGGRDKPDEAGLLLARQLPDKYVKLREEIERPLFEHYEPYHDAVSTGELDPPQFQSIEAPSDVWPHTKVERVLIERVEGMWSVEIAYRVAWDEEHTLGARIHDWHMHELCGSVGP